MTLIACTPNKRLLINANAPIGLLRAIARGNFLGEGTYAAAWRYRNAAFKLTCDPATKLLAQRLLTEAVPALPRIYDFQEDAARMGLRRYDALVMPLLKPVTAQQFAPIRRIYQQCKQEAELRYRRVSAQSIYLAEQMSVRVLGLRSQVLVAGDTQRLAEGFQWLAQFMKEWNFCADFGARRNWLQTQEGRLILADPIVRRICSLDATQVTGADDVIF